MKNHRRPFQYTSALAVALLTLTPGFLTSAFAMTAPSHEIVAGKPEPTDNHADKIGTRKAGHDDTIISSESSPNESDNQDNNEGSTT